MIQINKNSIWNKITRNFFKNLFQQYIQFQLSIDFQIGQELMQKKNQNFIENLQQQANQVIKVQQNAFNPIFQNIQRYQSQIKDESNLSEQYASNLSENEQSLSQQVKQQYKSNKTSSPVQNQNDQKDKRYLNRSSNNSHKKYSAAVRKNLFKYLSGDKKKRILQIYKPHQSSRIYYFCLIWQAKVELESKQFKKFINGFIKDIKEKIIKYTQQIFKTKNQKLKQFRSQQIEDLKTSLLSFKTFLTQNIEKGIQCLYKKNKKQMFKLPEYQRCVLIIKGLQKKYQTKTHNFDVEKVINAELQKKIRQYRITLPPVPQFIKIQKPISQLNNQAQRQTPVQGVSYRMTRRQSQFLINNEQTLKLREQKVQNNIKIQLQLQEGREKNTQKDFMNKKTAEQEDDDQQEQIKLLSIKQSQNQSIFGNFPPTINSFYPHPNQFRYSPHVDQKGFGFVNFPAIKQMPFPTNSEINSKNNGSDNKNFNSAQFPFVSSSQNSFQGAYINPMIPSFPSFQHPYMPFNPPNIPDKEQK